MKLHPVYLLAGPETGQKQEFIEQLKKGTAAALGEAPEESRFYCFDTPLGDVLSHIQNGSLFSAHKLIFLLNVEALSKPDQKILADYVKKPVSDATLVMVTDDFRIDALEKAVPKEAKKIFWEMFENQKRGFIKSYFSKMQKQVTDDAVSLILDLVENNTQDLKAACDGLSRFLQDKQPIEEEDVEKFIYHSKQENVFTLFGRFVQGDFPGCLEILQKLQLSAESAPVQTVIGLTWQVRNLLGLAEQTGLGIPFETACNQLRIRGKRNQGIYRAGLSNYSRQQMERILTRLAETDSALRSTRSDRHPLLLELFLYSAVKKKGSTLAAFPV